MRKLGVAPLALLVLSLALVAAPLVGLGPPTADPSGSSRTPTVGNGTTDVAIVDGVSADAKLVITRGDGLNASERRAVISRTMARIETIRSIEFDTRVPVETISRDEHRRRIQNRSEGLTEADRRHQNVKFEALFMIGEDENALAKREATLTGGIRGYYSTKRNRIVIVSDNSENPQLDELTLAHELVHAWQDQQYNLSRYNRTTEERNNAVAGVVEGDAGLLEWQYDQRCGEEWSCIDRPRTPSSGGDIHLGLSLLTYQPYNDGPRFVQDIGQDGGQEAVNGLYADPPESTEQTIHPERYGTDRPEWPRIRDRSNANWSPLRLENSVDYAEFGEAGMVSMFAFPAFARGDEPVITRGELIIRSGTEDEPPTRFDYAQPVTAGWDGDRLLPYVRDTGDGAEPGYVWKSRWDSNDDAQKFVEGYTAMLNYHGGERVRENTWRIPSGDFADGFRVRRYGRTVVITNAPTVRALDGVRDPTRGETTGSVRLSRGTPVVLPGATQATP